MVCYVSIIICTYNGATHLPQTLESLTHLHVPDEVEAELLIVDNGSTDETMRVAKAFYLPTIPIRYVSEPRRGKSYAYNTGIAAAQGDIILCTDDDVSVPPNWIEGMCMPIISGHADAVAGGIELDSHLQRPWMKRSDRIILGSTEGLTDGSPEMVYGANFAFSKAVLARVPGFDTELGPVGLGRLEEALFSKQLKEAGFTLVSAFKVAVKHNADESILLRTSYLDRSIKHSRSEAYVYHHWCHNSIRWPYFRLLKSLVGLGYLRMSHIKDWMFRREGCADWELEWVGKVSFFRQYLIENRRERNYEKYGLRKIRCAA